MHTYHEVKYKYLKPYYLCITSGLFSISIIIYLFSNNKNFEKNVLAFFCFLCLLFSQLFWCNPVCDSFIHKMDARIAKINAFLFIVYILFYKNLSSIVLFLYILLGCLTLFAFYRSDYYSRQEWCCDGHIFNHGLIHIAAFFLFLCVFL